MWSTSPWFDRHDPALEPVLGGKNTSLGILTDGRPAGAARASRSPPRPTARRSARRRACGDELDALLAALDSDGPGLGVGRRHQARERSSARRAPAVAGRAIRTRRTRALGRSCGHDDLPVAVRSSATCEDQPDASFAGEHDTYLWVRGADAVASTCCAAGPASTPTARSPTAAGWGYGEDGAAMSVGVQQMVLPRAAGVAFTLNPHDGDRSQVAIDASWGLGEAVVSGSRDPGQLPGRQGDGRDHLAGRSPTRPSSTASTAPTTWSSAEVEDGRDVRRRA